MSEIDLCIKIAVEAHAGETDERGEQQILRSLSVGLGGSTDEERMTGFLYKVLDTEKYSCAELQKRGVPTGVVNALRVLQGEGVTLHSGEDKNINPDYISSVVATGNPIAIRVKRNELSVLISQLDAGGEVAAAYRRSLAVVEEAIAKSEKVKKYQRKDGCEIAVLACGCFWGVQQRFSRIAGVTATYAGYCGGKEEMPAYEAVRSQSTGHVEAVLVEYDATKVDYKRLCQYFFEIHNPSQIDGQGPDKGSQYRSVIFCVNDEQRRVAEGVIADLRSRGHVVNTLLLEASDFWIAEDYHQDYYDKTGGDPYCHVWVRKF